jgi:hypothetical protein
MEFRVIPRVQKLIPKKESVIAVYNYFVYLGIYYIYIITSFLSLNITTDIERKYKITKMKNKILFFLGYKMKKENENVNKLKIGTESEKGLNLNDMSCPWFLHTG